MYANEPAPLIVYVVALTNAIVLVASKLACATLITSPAEIDPEPVFVKRRVVRVGAAAAMSAGRVTSSYIVPATCSSGFKKN